MKKTREAVGMGEEKKNNRNKKKNLPDLVRRQRMGRASANSSTATSSSRGGLKAVIRSLLRGESVSAQGSGPLQGSHV